MIGNNFFETGLTSKEAQKRLEKFGRNELVRTKQFSSLDIFVSQFKSPLIYILFVAGLITLSLKDFIDSLVIFFAVFVNTFLGFYQENKAQKTMLALKSFLLPKAKVIRDGLRQEILATQIVPGDIVVLAIGNRIPADGVLVEATDFSVNEAILTGESVPVGKEATKILSKDAKELSAQITQYPNIPVSSKIFMGTTVSTGIAKVLVTQTGMATEIGKIGERVEMIKKEKTPLQIQLGQLAKSLSIIIGGIILAVFVLGNLKGYQPLEIFTVSVALAVAAIPEGLVITLTVILALGMQRIAKKKAVVRKLLAAETLGSVSVICSDKTGTLTEGKLKVVKAVTEMPTEKRLKGVKVSATLESKNDWLVKAAILCNDLHDPLETAMREWAEEKIKRLASRDSFRMQKLKVKNIQEEYPRIDEVPFNHEHKYIATLHQIKRTGESLLFLSGAPEVILKRCQLSKNESKIWENHFEAFGAKGYRFVGFAYQILENQPSGEILNDRKLKIENSDLKNLIWLGLLVYEDPVREGVKEALRECQRAGIKVKVITGDYPATALAVLEKLDMKSTLVDDGVTLKNDKLKNFLADRILTGEELAKITDDELRQVIGKVVLFARTNPEQKLKIVEALKKSGEVVAMTGDGVNDAPALAKADIGIVVGDASDVAKETADLVLLNSNFATIVTAVEEGRNIYENIKKVTLYLLSDCSMEVVLISGALILGLPLPVTATQILWIKLIEDVFPGMALALEPEEKEVMQEPPRSKTTPFWNSQLKTLLFVIGFLSNLILLLFYWLAKSIFDYQRLQTTMFVALTISSLFIIFACRSLRKPFWQYSFFSNRYLICSIGLGLFFLFMAVYWSPLRVLLKTYPLGWMEWFSLIVLGFLNLLLIELTKWAFLFNRKKI